MKTIRNETKDKPLYIVFTSDGRNLLIEGHGSMPDSKSSGMRTVQSMKENGITCNMPDEAFHASEIETIVIEGEIERIGSYAFSRYPNLRRVEITAPVKSIGRGAFSFCHKLEKITFPCQLVSIEDFAFEGCCSIGSVVIPQNVNSVSPYAFIECGGLRTMAVADGNKTYDSRNGCNAIIFTSEKKLIAGCGGTIVPDDISVIGESAFCRHTELETMNVPKNIKTIEKNAFLDCVNLKKASFKDGLKAIGVNAFRGCLRLEGINIPRTVTDIGVNAFRNCFSIKEISVSEKNPIYCCPNGSSVIMETGTGKIIKGCRTSAIPQDARIIDTGAFSDTVGKRVFEIPDGIERIEEYAFHKTLRCVFIPDSVTYIDEMAFSGKMTSLLVLCNQGSFAEKFMAARKIKYYCIPKHGGPSAPSRTVAEEVELAMHEYEVYITTLSKNISQ